MVKKEILELLKASHIARELRSNEGIQLSGAIRRANRYALSIVQALEDAGLEAVLVNKSKQAS